MLGQICILPFSHFLGIVHGLHVLRRILQIEIYPVEVLTHHISLDGAWADLHDANIQSAELHPKRVAPCLHCILARTIRRHVSPGKFANDRAEIEDACTLRQGHGCIDHEWQQGLRHAKAAKEIHVHGLLVGGDITEPNEITRIQDARIVHDCVQHDIRVDHHGCCFLFHPGNVNIGRHITLHRDEALGRQLIQHSRALLLQCERQDHIPWVLTQLLHQHPSEATVAS
mmetsp:Transcript_3697/g.9804  ORF Transcript_3697/g.9804 Transcript_3697/m.9804 type:complete len:228 (-) Transcript_3697:447-1130(-)